MTRRHSSLQSCAFPISPIMRVIAFLSICTVIAADACAEPLPTIESPNILQPTHMRAILHHKNDQETLVLSLDYIDAGIMAVNGISDPQNKEFVWVLPIPGDSPEIQESSSLPLRMLMPITGPNILVLRFSDFLFVSFFLTTVALIAWCCTGQQIHKRTWMKLLFMGLIVISIVVAVVLLCAPRFDLLSERGLIASESLETSMIAPPADGYS